MTSDRESQPLDGDDAQDRIIDLLFSERTTGIDELRDLAFAVVTARLDGDPALSTQVQRWQDEIRDHQPDVADALIPQVADVAVALARIAGDATGLDPEELVQIARVVAAAATEPTAD